MANKTQYSPLIQGLKQAFDSRPQANGGYLLVYRQGWGDTTMLCHVPPGQYAWAAHDAYMAQDQLASTLAIAFDLSRSFDEQLPEHMRQFETLEAFAYKPLINIPDRTGHVPADRDREALQALLKPKPQLKLVVNNG